MNKESFHKIYSLKDELVSNFGFSLSKGNIKHESHHFDFYPDKNNITNENVTESIAIMTLHVGNCKLITPQKKLVQQFFQKLMKWIY